MEPEVNIRVRKVDHDMTKQVVEPAVEEYKKLMKKEVKVFANREVPIKVNLDADRYLPEYDETEGAESCMGGIVLHCRKGRIVCSNTLDDRLQLVYQEAIPEVRKILFPSFKKPVQKASAPTQGHGHK
jgi:V-type H+-transporting ATPase subunit E